MTAPEVAVIINSFNRISLLKKSLSSLQQIIENSNIPFVVFIFDAGSTDGSIEFIRDFQDNKNTNIFLIQSNDGEPSSFSYGVNKACKEASTKYDSIQYFFLYETDNVITSHIPVQNAIRLLASKRELAACGFTVKKHNGKAAGFGCKFPSLISLLMGQQLSFKMKINEVKPIWKQENGISFFFSDVVYTSPILIKRSSWESINGFDAQNFPFSDCDIDLARRLNIQGEKLAVTLSGEVIHDNQEIGSQWSATRTLSFYCARYKYFIKHKGAWIKAIKPLLFLTHVTEFMAMLALVIANKRPLKSLKSKSTLITKVWNDYR